LRGWAKAGRVDHRKTPGGLLRFKRSALDAFLDKQTDADEDQG
jgi:hypothetical protein